MAAERARPMAGSHGRSFGPAPLIVARNASTDFSPSWPM